MYTTEYYSAIKRNTLESVLMRWINLEPIYRVKWVRKKNINIVYWCICMESRKMVLMNLFQDSNGETERTDLWTWGGEEGEGEMDGESNMETYNSICRIDSQWELSVWLREFTQRLCDNLEEGDGEGGSRGKGRGCTYGWFLLMSDRKQHNSVKLLSFN